MVVPWFWWGVHLYWILSYNGYCSGHWGCTREYRGIECGLCGLGRVLGYVAKRFEGEKVAKRANFAQTKSTTLESKISEPCVSYVISVTCVNTVIHENTVTRVDCSLPSILRRNPTSLEEIQLPNTRDSSCPHPLVHQTCFYHPPHGNPSLVFLWTSEFKKSKNPILIFCQHTCFASFVLYNPPCPQHRIYHSVHHILNYHPHYY